MPAVAPSHHFAPSVIRESATTAKAPATFTASALLAEVGNEKSVLACRRKRVLFAQGDAADAVFYIQEGRVKLTVLSPHGKEATIAILEQGAFFGEGCLAGQDLCIATATAIDASTITRIEKGVMARILRDKPVFSTMFLAWLLSRNIRIQEDLVDHLFNSAEKRLARILLLMAHFGQDGAPMLVIPKISQETLAAMVGTTRSRVSFFLNRFKRRGFIEYADGLHVHSSLLNVVLHD